MKTAGFIVTRGQDLAFSVPLKLEKFKGHRYPILVYGDTATLFHSRAAARWAIRRHMEIQGVLWDELKREKAAELRIKRVQASAPARPRVKGCPPPKSPAARPPQKGSVSA